VHRIRERVAAVMVGINTVLRDDPLLTARCEERECKSPLRIIVDSRGRIPESSRVITESLNSGSRTILAVTSQIAPDKEESLKAKGVSIIKADGDDGQVDLQQLMIELAKREIDSVLLEGGGALNASALETGIVDKMMVFIAPKIIGGSAALTAVEGPGRALIADSILLKTVTVEKLAEDILVEGYL